MVMNKRKANKIKNSVTPKKFSISISISQKKPFYFNNSLYTTIHGIKKEIGGELI